ncbi:hypothetical protein QQ045_019791 [Rhodiola kirilowii]
MMKNGSCSIVDQRFLYERALDPQQIEDGLTEYGALGAFYFIVSKGPIHWDFPIVQGHFGASESFMMKRMSFKRMIQSSCRVEPCNTRHEIDLPKNKAFFE